MESGLEGRAAGRKSSTASPRRELGADRYRRRPPGPPGPIWRRWSSDPEGNVRLRSLDDAGEPYITESHQAKAPKDRIFLSYLSSRI